MFALRGVLIFQLDELGLKWGFGEDMKGRTKIHFEKIDNGF